MDKDGDVSQKVASDVSKGRTFEQKWSARFQVAEMLTPFCYH